METTIADRIRQLIAAGQLNVVTFAEKIGMSQGTVSHILNGRNKYPSADFLVKLVGSYPGLDLTWLLTGVGNPGIDPAPDGTDGSVAAEASLFPENETNPAIGAADAKERKETASSCTPSAVEQSMAQGFGLPSKPVRKIREIRIFYDDNTYETFVPQTKAP